MQKFVFVAALVAGVLSEAELPAAVDTSGTLYYTTFGGGANIHKADYTWTGGVLSFPSNAPLGPGVSGADGILFLPNGNLAIGGQGFSVLEVDLTGALVTTLAVPTASFHLSLSPGGKILYSASIPGGPTAITLSGSGSLVGASAAALPTAGTTSVLDTIAWAPGGTSLYTNSGPGGGGTVGTIVFAGGPESPTSATTSAPVALEASHGMAYDPFSSSFITMGDNEISRFSAAGALLETKVFSSSFIFDQGTVDGLGHIFAASNTGELVLIDYSATGTLLDASTIFDVKFLHTSLDDIAPQVGPGSPTGTVPEPATVIVWSVIAGIGGLGVCRRRRA